MKEQFVPYDLAVKLKDLGFDEPCIAGYEVTHYHKNIILRVPASSSILGIPAYGKYSHHIKHITKAPLWQQVFEWFRNRHGLGCHIWSGKISTIFYGYDIININSQESIIDNSEIGGGDCDYDTYGEAELACINKILELINK